QESETPKRPSRSLELKERLKGAKEVELGIIKELNDLSWEGANAQSALVEAFKTAGADLELQQRLMLTILRQGPWGVAALSMGLNDPRPLIYVMCAETLARIAATHPERSARCLASGELQGALIEAENFEVAFYAGVLLA